MECVSIRTHASLFIRSRCLVRIRTTRVRLCRARIPWKTSPRNKRRSYRFVSLRRATHERARGVQSFFLPFFSIFSLPFFFFARVRKRRTEERRYRCYDTHVVSLLDVRSGLCDVERAGGVEY